MKSNKILIFIISFILIYIMLAAAIYFRPWSKELPAVNNIKRSEESQPSKQKVEPNIVVDNPEPGDEIGLPLRISGQARVFENQLVYRLKDGNGDILSLGSIYANSPDMGLFGSFETDVNYPEPKNTAGELEVFDFSAKDESEIDKVIIPVIFKPVESLTVKVSFLNNKLDPEITCEKAFPVERRIPKTQETARAALAELLKGPTIDETERGYLTSINQGVKINSLTIEDGIAKVDFDETLQFQVGGSCRVTAIRAQIIQTLKQFPNIRNVIISINGRTEDILQP